MKDYCQVTFPAIDTAQQEILVAQLSDAGYEGFEQTDNELKAFIPLESYDAIPLEELVAAAGLSFNAQTIKSQNWNAVWESNFEPVIVDDFVAVRAAFHQPVAGVEHEIIITPKMSFGTGHHATTFLVMQQMRSIDFAGKTVCDFGTGTGILAILAEKLGAAKIDAVDNDDWSIANAAENFEMNSCSIITLKKDDRVTGNGNYDILLANINKNVIVDNFSSLLRQLAPGGILLLSGLLEADEEAILTLAAAVPLVKQEKTAKNNWIALRFAR